MEKNSVKNLCYMAMMTVLICICSWISIPFVIPFSLQTFAVFFALFLLGGKNGTVSIILYLLMGMIGLPVFSGFCGGIGHLLGPTGGYIVGFVLTGVTYTLLESSMEKHKTSVPFVLGLSLFSCYLSGTLWFVIMYSFQDNSMGVLNVLSICVLPYIIPDCIKIILAVYFHSKIKDKI